MVIVSGKLGISGVNMSKMFDGIWVKTMVLIRPIRAATAAADKAEIPASRLAAKKMLPRIAGSTP